MLSEDFETEFNSIISDKDQFTQTSASSVLIKLPLPKNNEKDKNKVNTVFEHCQLIQDPQNPKAVTIVKEFVTEEVKDYSITTGENSKASRYKYIREVIHPFFIPKPDIIESCEDLVRAALRSAKKDFPDFCPSLEVYHSPRFTAYGGVVRRTKERVGVHGLISKVHAHTSYSAMDPDPDKICLTDCDQAEDPKKCKQACKELNEAKKNSPPDSPLREQKPPCGKPNHQPPKCEKVKNCKPKLKKNCGPKASSSSTSDCDKNENDEVIVTDLNTNKGLNKDSDEVIVTNLISNKTPDEVIVTDTNENLNNTPDEYLVTNTDENEEQNQNSSAVTVNNSNTNLELNKIQDKENVNLGNIVPNIIFENDSKSVKTFMDAHNEAISTIKVAMEDFIEIVYKTTQNAVSLIATESAKALEKNKTSEGATPEEVLDRKLENKSSDKLRGISFFRKNENEPKEETKISDPSSEIIEKILKKADSAFCILSSHISKSLENLPKNIRNLHEKSSPYDQPKTDEKSAHVFTPDATNSVFSALKNKIYSIFSDAEPKSETPLSRNSSASFFSSGSDDKRSEK